MLKPSRATDYNIPIISPPAKHPKHCFDLVVDSVYNWQAASCEYKQYCDVVLTNSFRPRIFKEKGSRFDENMKKYNDVDYCVMCRSRQYLVKLGNYAMRLTSVVLKENN